MNPITYRVIHPLWFIRIPLMVCSTPVMATGSFNITTSDNINQGYPLPLLTPVFASLLLFIKEVLQCLNFLPIFLKLNTSLQFILGWVPLSFREFLFTSYHSFPFPRYILRILRVPSYA